MPDLDYILTINAGSSSIRIALYSKEKQLHPVLSGKIVQIGLKNAVFTIDQNSKKSEVAIDASNFHNVTLSLITYLEKQEWFHNVQAIGHRIVHGMMHTEAEVVTDDLLQELSRISDYDPDHLPAEIEIIQLLRQKYPNLMQVACFDTTFHISIPPVAKTFAIPKKYFDMGIQRYGFHGISYSFLMEDLRKQNETEAKGKIILAHLGNGASLAAIKDGKCGDTTMGFTPAGGVVMSTRSGDLDPGVAWYFMREGMDSKAFNNLINHQSGLLGISGLSGDMQALLQQENENNDAALAVDIFCYQIKKQIGAYAAALGGLDMLVFSGGIGENAPEIRSRICEGLGFLGIEIDEKQNKKNTPLISKTKGKTAIHIIHTDEEWMIAKTVSQKLKHLKIRS